MTPAVQAEAVDEKQRRRAHGSGSIRERAPGVWELRAFAGTDPATGRPRQKSRTFRGTGKGAQKELAKLITEVSEGRHGGSSATVAQLLDDWLAHLETRAKRRSTIETYQVNARRHLRPALGTIRLAALNARHLDDLYASKLAEGMHPNTVGQVHATIRAALTQAVKWGWATRNVATLATPPPKVRTERPTPSAPEVLAMAAMAVHDEDDDMATMVLLGGRLGLRRGELCGLRWSDVDVDQAVLHVRRSLGPARGVSCGRCPRICSHALGLPKAGRERTEPLEPGALVVLERYRRIQLDRLASANAAFDKDGWLFSYDGGRTHMRPKSVSLYVSSLARRAGVTPGVVLHSLRHFAATALNEGGVDAKTAAEILGHSRASMTLDTYTRAIPAQVRAAAGILDQLLLELPAGPVNSDGDQDGRKESSAAHDAARIQGAG